MIGERRDWWHRWRHWRHRNGSRYTGSQDEGRFHINCLKAVLWRTEDSLRKVFLQMGQKYQDCMIQWTIWELSCPKIRVSWFFSKKGSSRFHVKVNYLRRWIDWRELLTRRKVNFILLEIHWLIEEKAYEPICEANKKNIKRNQQPNTKHFRKGW